jgi:hypothetical protein
MGDFGNLLSLVCLFADGSLGRLIIVVRYLRLQCQYRDEGEAEGARKVMVMKNKDRLQWYYCALAQDLAFPYVLCFSAIQAKYSKITGGTEEDLVMGLQLEVRSLDQWVEQASPKQIFLHKCNVLYEHQ